MKTEISKIVDYFKKAIWICFGFFWLPWGVLIVIGLLESLFYEGFLYQLCKQFITKNVFSVIGMISITFQIIAFFLIVFNLIMFYSKRVAKIPDFFYFLYLLFIPIHFTFTYIAFIDSGSSHPGYTYINIENNMSLCTPFKSFIEEVPSGIKSCDFQYSLPIYTTITKD